MAVYQGTFSDRPNHVLRLTTNPGTGNISGNFTPVAWTLQLVRVSGVGSWSNDIRGSRSVNIGGTVINLGGFNYDTRNTTTINLGSGTVNVPHNADGTRTLSVSASANSSSTLGSASLSGSETLTTIPRASTPSFSTSAVDAGTAFTINTNRASTSFTHTIRYSFGTASGVVATGVGASFSWTPPLSLLSQIPNATSGTLTISLETFSGSTSIGTISRTLTLRAGSGVIPDFDTITHSEAVSLVASEIGAYVRNVSRLALAITGQSGIYGSTITSRSIQVAGQTINASSGTTQVINASGTVTITGTITDSRGRRRTRTVNITVLNYAPPVINAGAFQARRALSNGTPDEQGTHIRVDLNASVTSLVVSSVQKNTLNYRIYTRLRGASTWTLKANTTPAGISFNSFVTLSDYPIENSYEVLVEVRDKLSLSNISTTVATAAIFMHWGNGLGVGKFHEQGSLDVAGQVFQNGGLPVEPAGNISVTARSTPPPGWLLCNGAAVSRSTYARLFEAIGTSFGAGDGSTTFNVPNLLGRVVVGMNASESEFDTLGKTGGAKTHTLSVAEMPSHTHTQNAHNHTQNAHSHDSRVDTRSDILAGGGTTTALRSNTNVSHAGGPTTAVNNSTTATNQNTGGGGAHNNLQPYAAMPYIIKT